MGVGVGVVLVSVCLSVCLFSRTSNAMTSNIAAWTILKVRTLIASTVESVFRQLQWVWQFVKGQGQGHGDPAASLYCHCAITTSPIFIIFSVLNV